MESMPAAMTEVSGCPAMSPQSPPAVWLELHTRPSVHPVRSALRKFWAPVPWMLEIVVVVELCLHEYVEALVICGSFDIQCALSFFREGPRAGYTDRAQVTSRPDGLRPSRRRLERHSCGPIWWSETSSSCHSVKSVPADVRVLEGSVLVDQSMLTGESVPIEAGPVSKTMREH